MLSAEPFKLNLITRQKLLAYLEHLTPQQLADIPYGFNNNLWWNIVHVVVTQQLLTYHLSGNEMLIDRDWVEKFKKGTAPDDSIPKDQEIRKIKDLLLFTSQQLAQDYQAGKLNQYKEYPTSYGYTINTIEDAIMFNNSHESQHLGTCIAIKKLV